MLPTEALLAFKGASQVNKLTCCVAAAMAGLGGQAVGGIINVPGNQPTIQAGIDAAVNGDEVVVAPAPTSRPSTSLARRSPYGVRMGRR